MMKESSLHEIFSADTAFLIVGQNGSSMKFYASGKAVVIIGVGPSTHNSIEECSTRSSYVVSNQVPMLYVTNINSQKKVLQLPQTMFNSISRLDLYIALCLL